MLESLTKTSKQKSNDKTFHQLLHALIQMHTNNACPEKSITRLRLNQELSANKRRTCVKKINKDEEIRRCCRKTSKVQHLRIHTKHTTHMFTGS